MQVGDVVTPIVSRFPVVDPKGAPTGLEDDALGEPAIVKKIYRLCVEVEFIGSHVSCVYRRDEVKLVSSKDEWLATMQEVIGY